MNPERSLIEPETKSYCDWCDDLINNERYYVGDKGVFCSIKCVLDDGGIYEVER